MHNKLNRNLVCYNIAVCTRMKILERQQENPLFFPLQLLKKKL